jgi:hypothetical protein
MASKSQIDRICSRPLEEHVRERAHLNHRLIVGLRGPCSNADAGSGPNSLPVVHAPSQSPQVPFNQRWLMAIWVGLLQSELRNLTQTLDNRHKFAARSLTAGPATTSRHRGRCET